MTGILQPLDQSFAIVDPRTGNPTLYFIQWAQQRQIDISEGISAAQAQSIVAQFLADHPLVAGLGITLAPSGNIGAGVTISAEVQNVLDQLSTTHGTILFRGAADWQALAPGTIGQVLNSGGPGADPVWGAGGGGGSGNPWWWAPPANIFTYGGGDANAPAVTVDADVGLNVVWNVPVGGDVMRTLYKTLSNPSGDFDFIYHDEVYNNTVNFSTPIVGIGDFTNNFRIFLNQYNTSLGYADYRFKFGYNGGGGGTNFSPGPQNTVTNVHNRFQKVGGNVEISQCHDGKSWQVIWAGTVAANFGGVDPDHVFFGVSYNRTTGFPIVQNVDRFSLTGTAV